MVEHEPKMLIILPIIIPSSTSQKYVHVLPIILIITNKNNG